MTHFTIKQIDTEGDTAITHHHIKTPFIVSNRSLFTAYYHVHSEDPNGEYTFLTSSAGNDQYVEKHYELIGDDV